MSDLAQKKKSNGTMMYRIMKEKLVTSIDVVLPEPLPVEIVAPVAVKAATATHIAVKLSGLARYSMHNPIDDMAPDAYMGLCLNDNVVVANDGDEW